MIFLVKESLKSIGKGSSIIIVGIIITNIIGIVNQILLGRFLGSYYYGIFNLALSIMLTLAVLPNFGLGPGLTQFIPHNLKKKKNAEVKEATSFAIKLTIIIGILVSLPLFFLSDYISIVLFHDMNLSIVIKAVAITLTFWSLHNTTGALMQAFKKPEYYVYIENICFPIIQVIIFLLIYYLGFGLMGAILGVMASSVFSSLAYVYLFKTKLCKSKSFIGKRKKLNKKIRKELISISYPLFLAGFTYLFMQYTDKIIIGLYMTPTDVGVYSAALIIASAILFIYTAFSFNFRPIIAEYFALNDFESMKQIYITITKWIFFITLPLLIYIIIFSKNILQLIYGNSYVYGYLALSILSIGISMNGLTGLSGETLISIRESKLNLYSEITGASTNIILNIILIPFFGILGAAIGTSLSLVFRNSTSLYFVHKKLNFNPYNSNYIKITIISIISFLIIYLIFIKINAYYKFIVILPVYLTLYLILSIYTGCLDAQDKNLLKTAVIYAREILIKFFVR